MFDSNSVKVRFVISVFLNTGRSAMAFFSGLLLARGLHPTGYGDFTFLLSSFIAVKTMLDMGSSNAFYTFIAQRPRSRKFFLLYICWLALQFLFVVVLVALIMPQSLVEKIWVGQGRDMILLAFAASFLQEQVWQTMNQIGESTRQTVRIQLIGALLALTHLALISLLLYLEVLTVPRMFMLLIAEYLVATAAAYVFLRRGRSPQAVKEESARQIVSGYWRYCKPLILLSWIGFLCEFADRWMLQRFGGSVQQGFYQIAFQFAAVSLLATSSILKVFWKEIAEAHGRGDTERVREMYFKVSRGLIMFGAVISGFLIPWTREIIIVFLGPAYLSAVPVLMVMFLFPIYQSMGQIGGTMLLASGNTRAFTLITAAGSVIAIPFSYLVQAPVDGRPLPGLGLGAVGFGVKMVIFAVISVNLQAYVIACIFKWKYDWLYQIVGITLITGIGFLAKAPVDLSRGVALSDDKAALILSLSITGLLYFLLISCLFWTMPWLLGMTRESITMNLCKTKAYLFSLKRKYTG